MTTLNPLRLTFAQFQGTRTASNDLRADCPSYYDNFTDAVSGYVYLKEQGHELGIELHPDGSRYTVETGTFWTTGTIQECERALYAFYVHEIADDEVRAYLIDVLPPNEYRDGHELKREADTEESLCDLYKAWIHWEGLQGLNLGSADEHYFDARLTTEQQDWLKAYGDRWEEMLEAQDQGVSCPVNDPGCDGGEDTCHDACEAPARDDVATIDRIEDECEPELPDNGIAENAHQACDDARRDLTTLWNHEIGRGNRTGALLVEELVMQAGVLAERARKYAAACEGGAR